MIVNASMIDGGGEPDLQKTTEEAAAAASKTSASSYKKTIRLPIKIISNQYKFWFTYLYQDPDTQQVIESDRSPIVTYTFDIPNLTKGVLGLTLTQGYKSYGVKFTFDPLSVHEDVVIFESLTSTSIGDVVYIGTSNNVTIQTDSIATRWITVRTRDKWKDANFTDTGPLPVTPLNPDPDTSTAPGGMTTTSATAVVDPNDKSGFSAMPTIVWAQSTDVNTKGYSIRWSTDNPATTSNPMWEYNNVDGRGITTFVVTGLTPNITYYYQVAPKSSYNTIDWANKTSGTFSATDSTAGGGWSRLKSYLSIGGATEDLFKIGTQIVQKVNNSITISPTYTADTTVNNGIILNKSTTNVGNNYWLNTGHFRVGSETAFMYWNGSDLYTTGKINATGGSFTGDVKLDTGTLYAGALPNSGRRVRLNSSGIFAYNATDADATFTLDTAGYMNSKSGLIGGWSIGADKLEANSVILNSAGQISLGSTPSTSVFLSSSDTARIWVGSQSSSTAKFKVMADGTLYATGAVFTGYATSGQLTAAQTAAAADATTKANAAQTAAAGDATTKANAAKTAAEATAAAALATTNLEVAKKITADNVQAAISNNVTVIDGAKITTGTLDASAVTITSKGTHPVIIDSTGIYSDNFSIKSATGDANFNGKVTAANGSVIGDWKVDADGTLGSGLGLGGTYLYANNIITGNGVTFSMYTGKMIFAWQGFSAASGTPLTFINTSPQISSGGSVRINDAFAPSSDNAYSLGFTNARWQIVRSFGGVSTTSDARVKTNIKDSNLGLNFIKSLRPVSYKFISGGKVYKDGAQKEIVDGVIVEPEMVDRPGERTHWGFLAQDVKEAINQSGVEDFAGWQLDDISDPDSRQSLVHHQFLGPMTKAIQELSNMVESLQQEVNTLKGI